MRLIRNIAKVFFPAFVIEIFYCFIEMFLSHRPFMSFGLLLLCIGMALMCANTQVWAEGKIKERKYKNGEQHQSDSEESRAEVRHTDTHCA